MNPGAVPGATAARPAPRTAAIGLVARIAAVPATALGLSIPFDDTCGWAVQTLWSVFAMLAVLVQLLPPAGRAFGWSEPSGWMVGAIATGALVLHWVLIALPGVTSDAGFCLTVGTAAAVACCWLSPGRPR